MNTAVIAPTCPRCGTPIPPEAPGGLCPKCVLLGAATPSEAGGSARRMEAPPIEQVRAAFPHLEIVELVGQGGMGFVYAARQARLDRIVALKLLPVLAGSDPTFVERFDREGRLLARLNHPHIVTVHDFGQANGFCFLVMEYVDGVNLRQAMRSGRFSPREALAIVPQICEALQYAHEQGVLHRDIKPENILLDARGRVKIADFGIAKLVGDEATDFTLTASGARLGTPHYMAPEQIESPSAVDHRADIYSLGVVFYELLTGELPLGRFAPPSAKADLDARVDEIVLRALAKERELRQQSAGEVKTQVEEVRSEPEPSRSVAPPPAPSPGGATLRIPPEGRPFVLLALAALGVLLMADLPGLLRMTVSLLNQGLFPALLGVALTGAAGGLVWLSWRHRETLLAPFGLRDGDPTDRALRLTATGVLLVLAVRMGLQGMHLVGGVVSFVSALLGANWMVSLLTLLGLVAAGIWLRDRFRSVPVEVPRGAPPRWLNRAGWIFLSAGILAFLPTVLSWGSSTRVWHSASLLGLVGVAALTRSRLWRRVALAACWIGLIATVLGLTTLPALAAGVALPPGISVPDTQAFLGLALLFGLANGLAFLAGIVLLNRPDVKSAFGIAALPPPGAVANPWPHRLFWLVIALLALPAAAIVTGFLLPMLQARPGPNGTFGVGLLPFLVGALLFGLFWWTRPTASAAQPPSSWNPWPKRLFWSVVLLLVLPASLVLLGVVVPRVIGREAQGRKPGAFHRIENLVVPRVFGREAQPFPPVPVGGSAANSWAPKASFVRTDQASALGVEQDGQMAFVLFHPGPMDFDNDGNVNEAERTWTDRGFVTIPGLPAMPFARSQRDPGRLFLRYEPYELSKGRLLVLLGDGSIQQKQVTPPQVSTDNLPLIASLAGFDASKDSPDRVLAYPEATPTWWLEWSQPPATGDQVRLDMTLHTDRLGVLVADLGGQTVEAEVVRDLVAGDFRARISWSLDRQPDGSALLVAQAGLPGGPRFSVPVPDGSLERFRKAAESKSRRPVQDLAPNLVLVIPMGLGDPLKVEFRSSAPQP